MRTSSLLLRAAGVLALASLPALHAAPRRPDAVERLVLEATGEVEVSTAKASGFARFVRIVGPAGAAGRGSLPVPATKSTRVEDRAMAFLVEHGAAFGLRDAAGELRHAGTRQDRIGATHVTYEQQHRGVPVWGTRLRLHFDRDGDLVAANGAVVPRVNVDTEPTVDAASAAATARRSVARTIGETPRRGLRAAEPRLVIYDTGLARNIAGTVHLAWEVLVTAPGLRERVFVGAKSGGLVDRLPETDTALNRSVYHASTTTRVWKEGDALPYSGSGSSEGDAAINEIISASGETYNFFARLSGGDFLSWDGADGLMKSVHDHPRINDCPNANWDGTSTNFCAGFASDDIVAHEWAHAYTDSTHDLVYLGQVGALNEAYSDIFGETIDQLNGRGGDAPNAARTDACSAEVASGLQVTVNRPASIAGSYPAAGAEFGPSLVSPKSGDLVQALDEGNATGPATTDGCTPFSNAGAVAGKIALIDRGDCDFVVKVKNAQNAGATAAIVVNHAGNALVQMGGDDLSINIPSVFIGSSAGAAIKRELANGVNVTAGPASGGDASLRWVMGEDALALRDMWRPGCYGDPAFIGDARYYCGDEDNGGVHINSGVANRTFSLLVDGGSFRGRQVAGLGLIKAAHLYWRAAEVYQVANSDFADHADALEQSCQDLLGQNLPDPRTGEPSGQTLGAADCTALANTLLATSLRSNVQCVVTPLLDPDAPPKCASGAATSFFTAAFEGGPAGWTVSNQGAGANWPNRNWELRGSLPDGRSGKGYFAANPTEATGCAGGEDASGVMHLDSPVFTIPGNVTAPVVSFDHNVATEPLDDGGNVQVKVNGGAFRRVDAGNFVFNTYNARLNEENGNPLQEQPAFSGHDTNDSGGTWAQSRIDLAPYAGPGDRVQLRWSFGQDKCEGQEGWWLDDVSAYSCTSGPVEPCVAGPGTLCLLGGRYKATVTWENQFNGKRGAGKAIPYADFTGYFAFDDPNNLELIVKLLDFGDVVKLFYGQLTNLRFTLTLQDTRTGAVKTYRNGPDECGAIDQAAFPKLAVASSAAAACSPASDKLCLLGGRFQVEVDWRNQFNNATGRGASTKLSDLTGLFTFTDRRNVEILTKVLDFGDRILFIYGSVSDLEYTIKVTDTATGQAKTYHNPAGQYCGDIDNDF